MVCEKIYKKIAKKYIKRKCVLKKDMLSGNVLTVNDVPSTIITDCAFSYADISKDLLKIKNTCLANSVIQQFVYDPLINDLDLVLRYCHSILILDEGNAEQINTSDAIQNKSFKKLSGGYI